MLVGSEASMSLMDLEVVEAFMMLFVVVVL